MITWNRLLIIAHKRYFETGFHQRSLPQQQLSYLQTVYSEAVPLSDGAEQSSTHMDLCSRWGQSATTEKIPVAGWPQTAIWGSSRNGIINIMHAWPLSAKWSVPYSRLSRQLDELALRTEHLKFRISHYYIYLVFDAMWLLLKSWSKFYNISL